MLTLYVVPHAFGLASIDAKCLAAAAYLRGAVPAGEWTLVEDVYAVGNGATGDWSRLPALWDGDRAVYGYMEITSYVDERYGHKASRPSGTVSEDRNLQLSSNIEHRLSPLLSLLFYTSPENYTTTVRAAFGRSLPFPSSWILPVNHRRQEVENARLGGVDVTGAQLSGVAASLVEKPRRADAGPPSARAADPLTDGDILALHPVERIPRENSTSAVIETHGRLRGLVRDALLVYKDGQDGSERGVRKGLVDHENTEAHACLLFAHLGLAMVAAQHGMPNTWLTSILQSEYTALTRETILWVAEQQTWWRGNTRHSSLGKTLSSTDTSHDVASPLTERTRSLTAGIAQLSGIDRLQIPTFLYARSAAAIGRDGAIEFSPRLARGKPLGHEVDTIWIGVTGAAMTFLAFKVWQEGL